MEILSDGGWIGDPHIDVVPQTGIGGPGSPRAGTGGRVGIRVEERSNRSNLKHAFDPH